MTTVLFRSRALMLAVAAALCAPGVAMAQDPPRVIDTTPFGEAGARCAELRYTDFSRTEDALIQIAEAVPMQGEGAVPAYCQVEGYAWRSTRFRVRIPLDAWNGKLVVNGTGGQAGGLPNDVPSARNSAAQLTQGYATVHHNGGHYSTIADAKWSYMNDSAAAEFGFRAPYLATQAGKAIIEAFASAKPRKTYYLGCSNGGREAMIMAQTYPYAFDGIVAGAPSIAAADLFNNMFWVSELVREQSRQGFDMAAAKTLHAGVLAQCDARDGRADGVIDEPRSCKVDFKPLRCTGKASESCLTDRQIDIARKIYEGPRTADGRQIAPTSAFPGSEIAWVNFITPRWAIDYANDVYRYQAFTPAPGPHFTPKVEDLASYAKRMGGYDRIASALNPDLTRFEANGGKLISYYGWSDAFGGANAIMDYFAKAERVSGGAQPTAEFFRLFMVPGMDHCGGGIGPSVFDWLGAIDQWADKGQAPDSMTGMSLGPDRKPANPRVIAPYSSASLAQ